MQSISLAIFADVERDGVIDCPAGIRVTTGEGDVVASRGNWTDCVPNALNTIPFAPPSSNGSSNVTTPDDDYTAETDFLQLVVSDKLQYATAITEIQIWVPPNMGPRWEAEDGLIGTFIGSYEGRATGLNGTIEDGGVTLHQDAWVELAGVRTANGEAGSVDLTIVGGGNGTVEVGLNWLKNQTVTFSGSGNQSVSFDLWRGGNSITIFQAEGTPWVDAIVVG